MGSFKGVDYLDADSLLTDEEIATRDAVRGWVDDKVIPIIGKHYIAHEFPHELVKQMAEMGLFGITLPEEYGCAGAGHVTSGLVMQELERGDSGLRSFASVQSSLVMWPIMKFGSEDQKKEWLPKLASADSIGCFGLTEPDFGSNPGGMLTRAVKDGDDWILNGAKMWITNASLADVAIIWAKTGEIDDAKSIRGFIVETDRDGYVASAQTGKLSLLASDTSEISLQDVRVPASSMLPKSSGLSSPLGCLNQARYGIAWGVIGAAMACYDEALNYGLSRVQFDRPIAGFQLQQRRLVKMVTEITKAQLLCLQLGRLKERGTMKHTQVSLAKRNNVDRACVVARDARRLLGASGITSEYAAMRHMANLESVYTYEGTHDMHTLIVGKDISGLDAFSG
jgi:glutaryl-CoA dehydrogenase